MTKLSRKRVWRVLVLERLDGSQAHLSRVFSNRKKAFAYCRGKQSRIQVYSPNWGSAAKPREIGSYDKFCSELKNHDQLPLLLHRFGARAYYRLTLTTVD